MYKIEFWAYNYIDMELSDKKQHIIRCLKLGMDLESSMFCAECSFEEMDYLREDEQFSKYVKTIHALEEYRLLEDHELATRIAASKGNTHSIEWKLAHINPGRWANRISQSDDDDEGKSIAPEIYLPDNGRDNGKEEE